MGSTAVVQCDTFPLHNVDESTEVKELPDNYQRSSLVQQYTSIRSRHHMQRKQI